MNIEVENVIGFNDITHWIHECNRYLFLTKIHLIHPSVFPEISGDPINYIETIINLGNVSSEEEASSPKLLLHEPGEEPTIISLKDSIEFKIDLSPEKISYLKQTFKNISSKNWGEINQDNIESSQQILYELLLLIKKGVNELRGS